MTGNIITSEAIKSNSQRALAELWVRLAAGRRFPAFTDLDASALSHDPKQLVVWSVEGKGPRQRFRALFQGHNISQTFNSDWAGKTMDEVVPMSLRRVSLDAAKQCARTGVAVYMIISTIDVTGQKVDCHRLLLPFGRDRVEQVLASLQLTVVNARNRILKDFGMQADVVLSGIIQARAGGSAVSGRRDTRKAPRRAVRLTGRISFASKSLTCMVRDISESGASIEDANLALVPDRFRLIIEMESAERRCTVVWRKPTRIGVRFS
jgi:hypothetical protein